MSTAAAHDVLVCAACHGRLAIAPSHLACSACGASYPVDDGVPDFTGGSYYDGFRDEGELNVIQRAGLDHEMSGAEGRVAFYAARLASRSTAGRPLRVLDSGCGNGLSVDLLAERGMEAWGNDSSRLRRWQWRERRQRSRLVLADSSRLPFPDAWFDAVLSSGVIEHVGVTESSSAGYTVDPRPDRDAARVAFLRELLRVTYPAGVLFVDCPNGGFPIDFWHGDRPGGIRFHAADEGFLPSVEELREHLAAIGDWQATPVSPYRRLAMRQVGKHWYGRVLRWPMTALLFAMTLPGLRRLAASPLNPYLVVAITRRG
jgi:SAM-dependent methyltransferase